MLQRKLSTMLIGLGDVPEEDENRELPSQKSPGFHGHKLPPIDTSSGVLGLRREPRSSLSESILVGKGPDSGSLSQQKDSANGGAYRRASVPVTTSGGKRTSRPLFATLGRKVTSMVRTRMAFQRASKPKDLPEENTMEVIHEMPKEPRFSSFLSPEAQYALMKGYEDVIHHHLAKSHPEYCSVLRRNKTPMYQIGIRTNKTPLKNLGATSELEEDYGASENDETEDADDKSEKAGEDQNDIWEKEIRLMKTKSSIPVATSPTIQPSFVHRAKSLPNIIPRTRRLVLTYRIESAMDILDTVRRRQGHAAISPRVRLNSRPIAPLRDYNSWTNVWCKEFKQKACKSH